MGTIAFYSFHFLVRSKQKHMVNLMTDRNELFQRRRAASDQNECSINIEAADYAERNRSSDNFPIRN